MPLDNLFIRDAEYIRDDASGIDVYQVYDPHALVQAAGYLKYKSAVDFSESIYFRGQTKLYPGVVPSLFRGCTSKAAQDKRVNTLNKALLDIRSRSKILSKIPTLAHEPLLQHYGLRTTWIDVVDNIWVALWFGCHEAHVSGPNTSYLHYEKRISREGEPSFAYISLIAADMPGANTLAPGIYRGTNTDSIDLRVASPSIFLRPHSQHGILLRKRGDSTKRPLDYRSQLRGVIRIGLIDALSWLGVGGMLGAHALFPPPFYDRGYSIFLTNGFEGNPTVGSVMHVGA